MRLKNILEHSKHKSVILSLSHPESNPVDANTTPIIASDPKLTLLAYREHTKPNWINIYFVEAKSYE